jgi:sugar transferase (PEP-CTERM/EpsH1 system associated)
MHILWLKTELLHPIDKGGKIRSYQTLRHLRDAHQVTYLCLDDGTATESDAEQSVAYCHDLERVPFRAPRRRSPAFYAALARNVVSGLPYAIARYRSPAMTHAIRRLIAERGIDLLVCDFLVPSVNVPRELTVPAVLFQHNVEAAIWERHAQVATQAVPRAYLREQWRRMRRFERQETRRYDHVIAVSQADRDAMAAEYGLVRVSAVPTGVDTDYFRPAGDIARRPHDIVFTGSMDWMPNDDGIRWFVDTVYPRVRQRLPDASLTVVGRHPSPSLTEFLARADGVEVTGSVPDIRPYLERAAVAVVPLRVGGGTRLKIFEAMAMERPVVSTTIGAEGLAVESGRDLLIADDPESMAAEVLRVLSDHQLAERLARTGAERVRARFGWPQVAAQFARLCEETVASYKGERPRAAA